MKNLIRFCLILLVILSCKTNDVVNESSSITDEISETKDTIRLVNDEIEYEVIIIEAGFDAWMARRAKPKSFYSKTFLESKNIQYVTAWNSRVVSSKYDRSLYELQINYSQGIDYGFDVNYTLYHFFVFFEERYKQNLTSHNPRF